MKILQTPLAGLCILEPKVHRDHRGFFVETWRDQWLESIGAQHPFVQDNHARSEEAGVVRGLHYQAPPAAQSKLIWATQGAIYDVAVDIRLGSPTYGKAFGIELSSENFLRLYVPRGFAHGYMTLVPGTEVNYKVDSVYSPAHEGGIIWNDPALQIAWPKTVAPILSEKDTALPALAECASPFSW